MGYKMTILPMFPEEQKAKETKSCGYTISNPRTWTKAEIKWILDLKNKGFSIPQIAQSVGRTETSISIKLKRLKKSGDTYNEKHREEKYFVNEKFREYINPSSLLDCYAGGGFWNGKIAKVITNDINPECKTDYHTEALKLLCQEYINGNKYDVVDLDPFGSAFDCLDLAIKIAQKGLCVTLGEMGHKRWHRLDFVRTHYGIETEADFTSDFMIAQIQKIGLRNKKELVVFDKKDWQNISRVWFEIKPVKVTEQWQKKESLQQGLFD